MNLITNKLTDCIYKLINCLPKAEKYNLALHVLSDLEDECYCIWQTYTKEDLKNITGKKKITQGDFEEYAASLRYDDCLLR